MATLKADNLYAIHAAGEYGNDFVAHAKLTSASVTNASDTIDFMTIPAGARVYDCMSMCNAATSGTSPTVSLGWRYANGDAGGSATALLAATSIAAAARTRAGTAFTTIEVEKDIIIYGTAGGTGTSTAVTYEVIVNYQARGTK